MVVPGVHRVTVRGPTNPDAISGHGLSIEALKFNAGAVADNVAAQPNINGDVWEQNMTQYEPFCNRLSPSLFLDLDKLQLEFF